MLKLTQGCACASVLRNGQRYGSDKVAIVAVCPGWCTTDMGGPTAPRTPTQGADTAVRSVCQPAEARTGAACMYSCSAGHASGHVPRWPQVWLLSEPGNQRAINGKTLTDRHTFDWRAQ